MDTLKRDAHWILNEKYKGIETEDYFKDIKRLEDGEPVAYIIGWIPFLHAKINLNMRPLIPRPETEYWANEAYKIIEKEHGHVFRYSFADCYTGSGCIGIGALMHFPKAHCTFIDIGKEECAQAEENIKNNVYHRERANVVQGDAVDIIVGPYDAIFANPPYIKEDADNVDESVINWEPYRALYANDNGLLEIKKLLKEAGRHLKENGILFCEFGLGQEVDISKLEEANTWNIKFNTDQYGIVRWFEARIK